MRRRQAMTAIVTVVRGHRYKSEPRAFSPSAPLRRSEDWKETGITASPIQQAPSLAVVVMELRSIASAVRRITDSFRSNPETICIEKDEVARRIHAVAELIEGRATRD